MSHELVSGVYGNSTAPWHFAETGRDGRAKVREGLLTTVEALKLSGVGEVMVEPEPMYIKRNGREIQVPGHVAITRVDDDSNQIMSVQSDAYRIEQFQDAFLALGFEAPVWETMILLRDAKIAAGVLRIPDLDLILADGSHLATYLAAYTSHDASYALTYKDTNVRIECANLLYAADHQNAGRTIRILHREGKEAEKKRAAAIMTYAQERADYHSQLAERLLRVRLPRPRARALTEALLPSPEVSDPITPGERAASTRVEEQRGAVMACLGAEDLQNARDTAWAWVQAVGAYTDHQVNYRATRNQSADESRFLRTVVKGSTLAHRAVSLATQLAGVA